MPKSLKIGVWRVLLEVLAASWASWEHFGEQVVPKWAPRCSQDGPRCTTRAQLERTWSQVGAKMELCWPTWRPRWPTWEHLGSYLGSSETSWDDIFEKCWKCKKHWKPKCFLKFLEVRAVHLETFGGHVELCWRILALCWLILALCWAILSQLGDILNQHGTQERQHEPT